jgi:hypothetical protein
LIRALERDDLKLIHTASSVIARSSCDEAIQFFFFGSWIASRSLSSGAHSRDPLARNDGVDVAELA